jgi:hypothetical protein
MSPITLYLAVRVRVRLFVKPLPWFQDDPEKEPIGVEAGRRRFTMDPNALPPMPGTGINAEPSMQGLAPQAAPPQPDVQAIANGVMKGVNELMTQMEALGSQIPGTAKELKGVLDSMKEWLKAAITTIGQNQGEAQSPRTLV